MKEQFVPYDIAHKLKQKGFDETCFGFYSSHFASGMKLIICDTPKQGKFEGQECSAPLYQQAFDWFRDKHGLDCPVTTQDNKIFTFQIWDTIAGPFYAENKPISERVKKIKTFSWGSKTWYDSYREAQNEAINRLIELV